MTAQSTRRIEHIEEDILHTTIRIYSIRFHLNTITFRATCGTHSSVSEPLVVELVKKSLF